jgi:hypothetical protein
MEYLIPAIVGGLLGLYVAFTLGGAYLFNVLYCAVLFGIPFYFVIQSGSNFPTETLGFIITTHASGYAPELMDTWNVPSILRNRPMMILTKVSLLTNFILLFYFGFKIFSAYHWMGVPHLIFAMSILTILSKPSPFFLIELLFKNALIPFFSAIIGLMLI